MAVGWLYNPPSKCTVYGRVSKHLVPSYVPRQREGLTGPHSGVYIGPHDNKLANFSQRLAPESLSS